MTVTDNGRGPAIQGRKPAVNGAAAPDVDAWKALGRHMIKLPRWTDRPVAPVPKVAPLPGRLTARTARPARPAGDRLRYVPPVAALGTAAALQVAAMTDLVGGSVAKTLTDAGHHDMVGFGYGAAALLGVAVASCVEGGAAYLMDLYDRHLMARDSTWLLRVGMVAYVAASTGLLHWWLSHRHLPAMVSWVLAGMSGLALFLWSRGSRWKNRTEMRAAGHLDPAMPKLPAVAKLLHPWRALVTIWLTSWEPVRTPEEARARYAQWRTERRTAKSTTDSGETPTAEAASAQNSAQDDTPDSTEARAPEEKETAGQKVRKDSRSAQDVEAAVRALKRAEPTWSNRKIAAVANAPESTVRSILSRTETPERTDQPSEESREQPDGGDR